jgi:hypothetical protein
VFVAWYTFEAARLRKAAHAQLEIMRRTFAAQLEEQRRAAEPIFVWAGGGATQDYVEWEFTNEGGPVSHLTISMQSPTGAPTGVVAMITPDDWLGTSRKGVVTFEGDIDKELRFTIGFRTRIGGVGGFFFLATTHTKPIPTGSGWV